MGPGATPEQLAAEANSKAHHVADDLALERIRQAGINIDLRGQIEKLDGKVDDLAKSVARAEGIAHGEGKTTRLWLGVVGLLVAAAGLAPHFMHGGH